MAAVAISAGAGAVAPGASDSSCQSEGWTPVGFILDGDDFRPGDVGVLLNGPIGHGYSIYDLRKFAAAPDLHDALATLADRVFGVQIGDEPNVYADYDALLDLQRLVRAALSKATGR